MSVIEPGTSDCKTDALALSCGPSPSPSQTESWGGEIVPDLSWRYNKKASDNRSNQGPGNHKFNLVTKTSQKMAAPYTQVSVHENCIASDSKGAEDIIVDNPAQEENNF